MKIGIIGPDFSCQKIKEDLYHIAPGAQIQLYTREVAGDAIEVMDECEAACDAVIFSGCAVEQSVTSRRALHMPHGFVSKGGTSISKVFRQMQAQGFALDNFSIDVVEPQVLEDVFCELDIKPQNIFTYPYLSYDESNYIQWHLKLWSEKKISVLLTGFVHIYHKLKKEGYPIFYLPVTRSLVRVCYEKIAGQMALNEAQYSQIAVEILRLREAAENSENYYTNMIKKCEAQSLIIDYARNIQASLFQPGQQDYVIFTSRGCVENEKNYIYIQKLQSAIAHIGFHASLGIGTGVTAYKAETNARKALSHTLAGSGRGIYLINEDNMLQGPLGSPSEIQYSLASPDEKTQEIARKTELSCESIEKIKSIIEIRKSPIFDAVQLADSLSVSVRSARRIMSRLIAAGYARVCAKESAASGGRPKSFIEILFHKDNA